MRLGQAGEDIARRHLEERGYALREANYRCRWGEVDLVMEHEGAVVFVEVRTKRSTAFGTPEESVTAAKRKRLTATAYTYLQEHDLDVPFQHRSCRHRDEHAGRGHAGDTPGERRH